MTRAADEPTRPAPAPALRRAAPTLPALVVAAAALACGCGDRASDAAGPPDVLVLVMDTTRADRCSFLGYDRPTTPRLAEFARESVVFTEAWSPASWTFPAHVALFTGCRAADAGVSSPDRPVLPDSATTLAEILAAAGWRTGCFTSNGWIAAHSGLTQGFGTVVPVYRPPYRETAGEAHDAALAFMRARRAEGRRFLAFVNDVEPHAPWTPPDEFQSAFVRPGTSPEAVAEARTLRHPRTSLAFAGREQFSDAVRHAASDLYDAEIAGLDAEVGRLLDTMRAEGLLRNTLVVITSDHGEGLGDHGWMEHGVLLHRELLRVPLLVRPPGGCAPHTVRDVVRLHDVFATVLESCGLPVPPQTESRSLLADTRDRIALASERTREDMCRGIEQMTSPAEAAKFRIARSSVFDGRFHLMVDETGATELYDVTSDPAERTNVADAEPGTVSRLRARLDVR